MFLVHPLDTRQQALAFLAGGASLSWVSRKLGVSRSAIRDWRDNGAARPTLLAHRCPLCNDVPLDEKAYAALLGFYLGDGVVSPMARYHSFRVSCDRTYPGIIDDVECLVRLVHPGSRVFRVRAPGVIVVHSNWQHWPCLFPQHAPGRKHDRPILLEPWQQAITEAHPADLLRGLFHSDGARVRNWASRQVGGERKRYDYPRWQFSNRSEDIHLICQIALDRLGILWRRSSINTTSVSRREAVAALDEAIGLKR